MVTISFRERLPQLFVTNPHTLWIEYDVVNNVLSEKKTADPLELQKIGAKLVSLWSQSHKTLPEQIQATKNVIKEMEKTPISSLQNRQLDSLGYQNIEAVAFQFVELKKILERYLTEQEETMGEIEQEEKKRFNCFREKWIRSLKRGGVLVSV